MFVESEGLGRLPVISVVPNLDLTLPPTCGLLLVNGLLHQLIAPSTSMVVTSAPGMTVHTLVRPSSANVVLSLVLETTFHPNSRHL